MSSPKEWTIMFYLASDNPLAPSTVSQLKAIKNAGFHPEANVIAQFDPRTVGTPTHIFDVNIINKLKKHGAPDIGFAGNDSFIRKLMEDKLWRNQKDRNGKSLIRDQLRELLSEKHRIDYNPPVPPEIRNGVGHNGDGALQEPDPHKSLESFLKFCANKYPAKHYMLFILGHGLVVGNDMFLFDEHAAEHSLTLSGLGEILTEFTREIELENGRFEFLGLHSCSVSSLEVAYELQGTANYMMASQGPAFVGSWPYRQMLIRLFNNLNDEGSNIDVEPMLSKMFDYCLHNSADYLLAGYSFDLCLSNLTNVSKMTEALQELARALTEGLADPANKGEPDPMARDFILLAHLKSQSYYQESYTDLFDFCFCLSTSCRQVTEVGGKLSDRVQAIQTACGEVIERFENQGGDNDLIVRAGFAGPESQYSHGMSVYFPWTEPASDSPIWSRETADGRIVGQYEKYKFEETHWRTFLQAYFDQTLRQTQKTESRLAARNILGREPDVQDPEADLFEDIASLVFNEEGQLNRNKVNTNGGEILKLSPLDGVGEDGVYPSIKNYPHDTRDRRERGKQAGWGNIPLSPDLLK